MLKLVNYFYIFFGNKYIFGFIFINSIKELQRDRIFNIIRGETKAYI